jgi:4a-hydroxytetrahydrobiopterin dehydratase
MSLVKLNNEEIKNEMMNLSEWSFDENSMMISKTYKFKGYYKTILFVNQVAWVAQKLGHHPDLTVKFGTVEVSYQTHDVGGISELDFKAAKEVEAIFF